MRSAKRYERLLKANGIPLPSQRGKDGEPATPTPKKRGKAANGGDDEESPSKKPRAKKVAVKKDESDESDAIKNEEED